MTAPPRVSRTRVGVIAATLLAAFVPATVRGAYEFDAYTWSDDSARASVAAYVDESENLEQSYYLAVVFSYYGRYYAEYAYERGDGARFYDAAVYHYYAYVYFDALTAYQDGKATVGAREYAYLAYLFCWYAHVT